MKYQRNRTKSLILRLTEEEKNLLKNKAGAQQTSVTDYILISSFCQESKTVSAVKPILEKLSELSELLSKSKESADSVLWQDISDLQKAVYSEICKLVRDFSGHERRQEKA